MPREAQKFIPNAPRPPSARAARAAAAAAAAAVTRLDSRSHNLLPEEEEGGAGDGGGEGGKAGRCAARVPMLFRCCLEQRTVHYATTAACSSAVDAGSIQLRPAPRGSSTGWGSNLP
jgi:hypothetical protein